MNSKRNRRGIPIEFKGDLKENSTGILMEFVHDPKK